MKAAIGCAFGCGALALILFVAGGAGVWWLVAPGEQSRTAAIVSPAANGTFHVADLGSDPGTIALLDRFVLEAQRQQQEQQNMPAWLAGMQRAGAAQSSPSAGFRLLLPREATITLEPSAEAEDGYAIVAALNPRGMTQLLRLMLGSSEETRRYRSHELTRVDTDGWATVAGGTFLFATELDALKLALDRLEERGSVATGPPVVLGAPERAWDVTGAVDNDNGAVDEFLWDGVAPPAGLERATFGVDLATADVMTGRLLADCASPAHADAMLRALHAKLAEEARELAAKDLELRAAFRTEGARAVLDWEVSGLAGAVSRWIATAGQGGAPATAEPDSTVTW
jgi:hypothetical protein